MAGPALALKGVLAGWGAFCGTHLFMSHTPVRDYLVEKMGEKGFLSAYSLVSVGTLAPACYAYLIGRGRGPIIHHLGENAIAQYTGSALKWMGFFTTSQGYISQSPVIDKTAYKPKDHVEVTGIQRITRHPVFCGAAMWGLGCMLQRGRLIDLVFWGAFPAFYFIGSIHQDYRNADRLPRQYWNETSILPFHAVITGHQSVSKAYEEMSPMSIRCIFFAGILALALRGRMRRDFWYPTRSYKAW